MGKGKEAGTGRACVGGPVSMRENKSVSRRRAAHAFDTGHAVAVAHAFDTGHAAVAHAFMGFVPLGCVLRSVHGGCGSAERAFAVRESLYANRQSLCKRAALMQASNSYANR